MSGLDHLNLARQLRRATASSPSVDGPWQWGTVAAVGGGTVDVYLDNNTGPITAGLRYLTSYSPDVGDAVLIARMGGASQTARVVLGTISYSII